MSTDLNNLKKNFRIFLCGDVMTGRGIDQILSHPNKPRLYEDFIKDAREYVHLAEIANGKISYPVSVDYIWGDALALWNKLKPNIKIINLETAITQHNHYWPTKSIHYRMHPANINIFTAAGIDICTLANNHILDWGFDGLSETLSTLKNANIKFSGAGENISQAIQPAIVELNSKNRVLVLSIGSLSSGISPDWQATSMSPGLTSANFNQQPISIKENIKQYKKPGDIVVLSIHWGSNWGYEVPESFQSFAHRLIDDAGVDVIFGHSSHHPRPIEIYNGKPILYGCGDFINDYEGISGYEEYRDDLTFMYFLDFDTKSLRFEKITLIPLQIKHFSLHQATKKDSLWLLQMLNDSSINFGTQFTADTHSIITIKNNDFKH